MFSLRIPPVLICIEDFGIRLHDCQRHLEQSVARQQISAFDPENIIADSLSGSPVEDCGKA
jgi:hypothetical protein